MPAPPLKVISLLVIIVCSALGINFLYPRATQVTGQQFNAVADTYVGSYAPSSTDASQNWVDSEVIWSSSQFQYAYFLFDLFSIPSYAQITSIKLWTNIVSMFYTGHCWYQVTWADTNWAENTMTWANQPNHGGVGGYNILEFGDSGAYGTGWIAWSIYNGFGSSVPISADRKMAFVIYPNSDFKSSDSPTHQIQIGSHRGGNSAYLIISYTIPNFTLTVSVKDSNSNPIQGAQVTSPFTGTTDANGNSASSVNGGSQTVSVTYQGVTYGPQTVTMDSDKTVYFTIPVYSVTVKVVDASNQPISGAILTQPFSGTTDSAGSCIGQLTAGTYTFSASAGSKSTTQTIAISSSQTVTLTIAGFSYQLTVVVKDQVGNPLPASVKVDTASGTCDQFGKVVLNVGGGTRSILASVKVKDKVYDSSTTITVSQNSLQQVTINRRFFWTFNINYTDGSSANGKVIASSIKENLTVSIVGGYGEGYLIDTTYEFDFVASPAVTLKSVSVVNDGDLYATISKTQLTSTTTSTSTPQGSTGTVVSSGMSPTGEVLLNPDTPIYILLGVVVVVFIFAGIIRARHRRR